MIGIYAIQNCVNGKIYIGQSIDIERRWQQEKKMKKLNEHLLRAMKKYSVERFSFYIIEECIKEKLNEREAFYIKLYHSLNPEFGYNKTSGGDNAFSRPYQKLSDEHKRKISEANKHHRPTKEAIKKSVETRRKTLLEKHKVDIWCLETDEIYHSIEEVVEKLGIKTGQVFACLRKACEKSNGYHICYAEEKTTRNFNLHPYKNNGGTKNWKDDTRKKISEKAKVRWTNMTDDERNELSEKLRIANLGKILSEEHKRKIGESQKGMKRKEGSGKNISDAKKKAYREKASRKIVCIETNEEFFTFKEAADILRERFPKVCSDGIKRCISGSQKSSGGLHFRIKKV